MTWGARPAREERARGELVLQLQLDFDGPPRTAEELLARLRAYGLRGITRCRLTNNRAVMVSFSGDELRVHRAYLAAPPEVLQAMVLFIGGRNRAERRLAQRAILAFPVQTPARSGRRRSARSRPGDEALERELRTWHQDYNRRYFGNALREIPIRVSGRMRTRLGQYTVASELGDPAEIAISRAHIRRHGWAEALHTLLHEMVHQWQAESGHPIDHGAGFRKKASEVGIAPQARRALTGGAPAGRVVNGGDVSSRAARRDGIG